MSSTIKELSPVSVQLDITVPVEEIKKAEDKAFAAIRKSANIRGFRKGKAPRNVLNRIYGSQILQDIRSEVISRSFMAAVMEHKVNPVSEPQIDATELKRGEDYKYTITLEVSPTLDDVNYDGIELEQEKVAATDEQVKEELDRMRMPMATANDLETPRPCEMGDLVKVEMKRWEGEDWAETPMPPQDIILESGVTPEPFLEALPGLNVGDEKEVEFANPNVEKGLKFNCKILAVQERKMPELDDEFAKDVSDFDTLKELQDDIAKRITDTLEQNEKDRVRQILFDKLKEKNPMELPPSILERQAENMKAQFNNILEQAKLAGGDDSDEKDEKNEDFDERSNEAAKGIVHQHFLLKEIARIGDIKVTPEDLEIEFEKMSKTSGMPVAQIKAQFGKSERASEMEFVLLERKIFDFVAPKVKINMVEPKATDTADSKKG